MTNDEINEFFRNLRELRRTCRRTMSSDDRLAVLIAACIDFGFNTKRQVIGVLRRLDFKDNHIIRVLGVYAGTQWRQAEDGSYISLP